MRSIRTGTFLSIFLFIALIGVLPAWGHSGSWSYVATGGIGLLLIALVFLLLTRRI